MTPTTQLITELNREIKALELDRVNVHHDGVREDIKLRIAALKQRIEFLKKDVF